MKLGIPDNLRKEIWILLTCSYLNKSPNLYKNLLKNPDETILNRIKRDLHRTFPHVNNLNLENLLNVLIAYSQFDIQVGYCQGMGFVVAVLLMVIEDQELSF